MEVFILKGYGKEVNYRMGVPLLQDVVQSMEQAILAKEGLIFFLVLILNFNFLCIPLSISFLGLQTLGYHIMPRFILIFL